ncbi:hypothetical protein [Mesonia aquimarina]|uniref:hypothetical protein n=1 Tax=Mesonia aquimarina TaxID=1504967 RepID=UPI000EF630C1|nr:hypothetical protein [Mesonia aquimarina]
MKKIIVLFLILFVSFQSNAQRTEVLDNYKYVVVPLDYDFLGNEENKFLLNSLTKHLLNQINFKTYIESDPVLSNLSVDRCLGLYADVTGTPTGLFQMNTKAKLLLKDCEGNVVFQSEEGSSKLKDYEAAYKDALRSAFESFGAYYHHYNGKQGFYEEYNDSINKNLEEKNELDKATYFTFLRGNTSYALKKIEAGYLLTEKESGTRVGHLHYTKSENILYNSDKINGTVSFNESGNLIVEYFDKETEQLKQITFKRKMED